MRSGTSRVRTAGLRSAGVAVLVGGLFVSGVDVASAQSAPVRSTTAGADAVRQDIPMAAAAADDNSLTSVGTDFWVAFPVNAGNPDPLLTLSISGAQAGTGTVSAPAPGKSGPQAFTVTPGQVTQLTIDPSLSVNDTDGVGDLGVHVTSTVPVSVYGTDHVEYTSSGWLALPTSALGRSYRALGYTTLIGGSGLSSQLTVIGTADATTITVTPATVVDGHPAGVSFTQTLNQGQTYQLQATTVGQDISGTTIVGSAPIAVMGGNGCGNVPNGAYACDQLEQQMAPISTWGTHFASVRYATRTKGDTYRVLANEDNTVVSVSGVAVSTLGAGEFYEAVLPANAASAGSEGVQIDASKPVQVAQYGNGTTFDDTTGDPLMLLVPPTGQYLDSYTISAPDIPTTGGAFSPYASLVVPTDDVGQVQLDGTSVPRTSFKPIGTSGYSGAQLTISTGTHSFTGPNPFGLQIYEWGTFDGFGYPGGTALIRISGPAESPAAPNSATATAGNQNATITWSAPADDGGSAVTSYTVRASTGGTPVDGKTCTLASPFTPPLQCTIQGLTNDTPYTFTVTATNAVGTGPASAGTDAVTPAGAPASAPGAPTAATAAAGDSQANIAWSAPDTDGGAPITSYQVQALVNGSPITGKTCTSNSPFTPPLTCSVAGLTNGTAYTFTVTATNSAGTGPASQATTAVTPDPAATAPQAPTDVTATAEDAQATVSFAAPLDDGGEPVTSYQVQAYSGADPVAGKTCTLSSPLTPPLNCVVTGLTNGTSYTFTITATNSVGTSPASDASNTVTPTPAPTAPAAPTSPQATPGDQQATVTFTAPDTDGGAPISTYTVQAYAGGAPIAGKTCTVTSPFIEPLNCTVTGLTNGSIYTFTVTATNSAGTSVESATSAAITPTAADTVPSAPTAVAATAGDRQVDVTWSTPNTDGGAAINSYTVTTLVNGVPVPGLSCTVAAPFTAPLRCTVSGLTNGTVYTFTVRAGNTVGTGPASLPSDPVTPIPAPTAPAAPTKVTAIPGNARATVTFTAPTNNGGAPITSYQVQAYAGGKAVSGATCTVTIRPAAPQTALTCTITGLRNNTAHTFRVRAVNAVGAGAFSAASASVTPAAPTVKPAAPSKVTAVPGNAKATVSFTAPGSTGGTPITSYRVQAYAGGKIVRGATCTVKVGGPASALRCTVAGLRNGTAYVFAVTATNKVGTSGRSLFSAAVVPAAPPTLPSALSKGLFGSAYRGKITATTGTAPITYRRTAGTLPAGLVLNSRTGAITGTPRVAGAYRITMKATNRAGSATRTYTLLVGAIAPSAPRNIRSTRIDGGLTITFTQPASTGGAPITSYQTSLDGKTWRTLRTTGASPIKATIGDLVNGQQYRVYVRAVNKAGGGARPSFLATPGWFTDQISKAARAAEVAVPGNPKAYRGPQVNTVATNRDAQGRIVVTPAFAAGRSLSPGQGIVLGGASVFDFDSPVLKPSSIAELRQIVPSLKKARAITCQGYSDYASGVLSHELQVSDGRARNVCNWLTSHGARLVTTTQSMGPANPVVIGGTGPSRTGNRRVIISVTR